MTDPSIEGNLIYKFIPFSINSLKLLIKGEIYFGVPHNLNDPFEGEFFLESFDSYPDFDFIKETYETSFNLPYYLIKRRLDEFKSKPEVFHEDLYKFLNTKLKSEYGVSCFTEHPLEILMWSHYADSFKGLCLIFDKDILTASLKSQNATIELAKVNYNALLPNVTPNYQSGGLNYTGLENVFIHKQPNWFYENELRFHCHFPDINSVRSIRFDKNALKGIITGAKIDYDSLHTLLRLINNDSAYQVKWRDARKNISERKLDLLVKPVSYAFAKSLSITK